MSKESWSSYTYSRKKIDYKIKTVTRDKGGQGVIIKGTIQQEVLILVNIYAPHIEAPRYIKQLITN